MKKISLFTINLFIIVFGFGLFTYCSSNSLTPEETEAQQMTLTQIRQNTGYAWFDIEFNSYKPDTSLVSQIKSSYQNSGLEFLVFVNPSCACVGTQKSFPDVIKILNDAGITESKYKIYSMLTYKSPHPYKSVLDLVQLPAVFVMKNGQAKYSVMDSMYHYSQINQNTKYLIEEFILKGIK